MTDLSLLIADDHPLFRLGLRYALQNQGFRVVGEASGGHEAVSFCRRSPPDVVLLDVKMPELDGIEACRAIAPLGPIVLMLSTFQEPAILSAAREAGAKGFLSKETDPGELAVMIRRISQAPERDWFPPVHLPQLTPRELQVLKGIGAGKSNKAVAKELGLSPETVKDYLNGVYRKLEVNDRLMALSRAKELGLL